MRIDSHLHVNFAGMSIRDVIARLDRQRLDKCWLLSWEEHRPLRGQYKPVTIEDIDQARKQYPGRFIPFCAPDPASPDGAARLLHWQEQGFQGCGEVKTTVRWDSEVMEPYLTTVQRLAWPLVFHMEGGHTVHCPTNRTERVIARLLDSTRLNGLSGKAMRYLERLYRPLRSIRSRMETAFPGYLLDFASLEARVRQFPGIRFVGHGPMFWQGISAVLDPTVRYPRGRVVPGGIVHHFLEHYDHFYADLSGESGYKALARDLRHAKEFLERFKHKLLFGTDNISLDLEGLLNSLRLSSDAERLIMGANAETLCPGNAVDHAITK